MSAAISTGPTSNNGVSDVFTITAPDGSKATVHSQGGHVTSWLGTSGDERLYMSPSAVYQRGKALRGGVPIIFPQFSDMGAGPTHGVARNRQWTRVDNNEEDGTGRFVFSIPKNDKEFPLHACDLTLTVTVSDVELRLTAKIENKSTVCDDDNNNNNNNDETVVATQQPNGARPDFAFAFHTYLSVSNIENITLKGFTDKMPFLDNLRNRMLISPDNSEAVAISKIDREVDRVYLAVCPSHQEEEPQQEDGKFIIVDNELSRNLIVFGENLSDVVLWNPWAEKNSKLADLPQPDGYKSFLCIEHGAIARRVAMPRHGEAWEGSQIIQCVKH